MTLGTRTAPPPPSPVDPARHPVADPAVEIRSQRRPTRDWATLLAGKRFLVTGAAGFIGGHLFRTLSDLGLDVVGTALHQEEVQVLRRRGYRAEVLDLTSGEGWSPLLDGVDVVFNVAARFQEVSDDEAVYERVNHHGALELARSAVRAGVERFVHCSTVGVHGNVRQVPATEETPTNPMDGYHRTKLAGERAILHMADGLPSDGPVVTVNRPAMVYGPGDRRMLKLFRRVLSGRFRMIGSGNVLAHLGHVDDQTESFLHCAVAPREAVHGEAFNIASGEPLTLNELVEVIARSEGRTIPRGKVPVAPVWAAALACEVACRPFGLEPPLFRRRVGFFTHNRAFDLTKAEERLGYRSQWGHDEGIDDTIGWYRRVGWL